MTLDIFREAVKTKAKKLNIEPGFLLIALGGVSEWDGHPETKGLIEKRISEYYYRKVVADMTEAARVQCSSPSKNTRLAGEEALKEIGLKDTGAYGITSQDLLTFNNKQDTFKTVHILAVKKVLNDIRGLKTRYGIEPLVDIITDKCSDELGRLREFAKLFHNDLSEN